MCRQVIARPPALVGRDGPIEWLAGHVSVRLRALPPWLGPADKPMTLQI